MSEKNMIYLHPLPVRIWHWLNALGIVTLCITGIQIRFPEYGPRSFKPPPGGAVVFPCALLHAVSEVTSGRRYAFLPFLYDEAAARTRTCPTISPAVRFLTSPILPVRQKAQAIAHPTWVEMQKVIAGVSGMKTDSMCRPSASSSRNFSVPSADRSRLRMAGVVNEK